MRMRFILVECRGNPWPIPQWRATCVLKDKTIDIFFFKKTKALAKKHVKRHYPTATFTDDQ